MAERLMESVEAPQGRGHYVYVLECADGTLYTGYAVSVPRRLAEHQAGKASRCTRARLPVTLVAAWDLGDRSTALRAEAAFKRLSRARKVERVSRRPLGAWLA